MGAKVCHYCGKYTARIWDNLLYFSSLVAIFAFLVSAFPFVRATTEYYWKMFFEGDSIRVASLDTFDGGALENKGYRSLTFLRISADAPGLQTFYLLDVMKSAEPGEVAIFVADPKVTYQLLPKVDDYDLDLAKRIDRPEIFPVMFSKDDPHLKARIEKMTAEGERALPEYSCDGKVHYSAGGDEHQWPFACTALIAVSPSVQSYWAAKERARRVGAGENG